ncbi:MULTISPECIES: tryptophan--tRNA ligase [unclassified Bacillus (in: firmicutes)]|uniref:tryptophan--tRNA ligase n=1 Tax=unclassified Bacillus (in: firmicutes) TaxID=185979 RepID=UPI0004E0C0CE|nr:MULTISPECIES: tryptophan--tRNA ligase [unclassified Bacillus (in: firmicutes)]CAI9396563.1 Tryptophan--tRNA ligase [Bacillus sp. T2.9-1]
MKNIVLTGIKPTGQIHLGNYIGAIKPALKLAENDEDQAAYFIADYHGLTKIHDRETFRTLTYGVAATWLALGLDPKKVIFYRQSNVPEIFELNWILACFTPKGLMNRAHAYKGIVDSNKLAGKDIDDGVNMGLFTYPILMAADILAFQANMVPVGKDQIQHVEIARDIAESFNHQYGETFVLPEYIVDDDTSILPGLDGRKMSKSYHNTIPLFEEPTKLQKLINKIKTDSLPPEAPKETETSILFTLYKEFASVEETEEMRKRYENGVGWGEVKKELFYVMNRFLEEPRKKYNELMANPEQIDAILAKGAEKARARTLPTLEEVRKQLGVSR